MRGTTAVPSIALAIVLVACGGDPVARKPAFDAAVEFGRVKSARAALTSARTALAAKRAELASLEAKVRLDATEQAQRAELETQVKQAQDAFDRAYSTDQQTLTGFLNVALNDLPDAPETREALSLYSAQAIRNAQDLITNNGDYAKAVELLETAEGYFAAIRASVPADLRRELETARAFRYLGKDRFDRVREGMSQADTRLITGTPFYANVREHEERGAKIITWRFPREDGGVAAIDFRNGRVVATTWDLADPK